MISSILNFLLRSAVLVLFLISVNYFVLEEFFKTDFTALYYGIYIYFYMMITIIHVFMVRALKKRPQQYIIVFMSSMGIKIFLSLIVLVVIMYSGLDKTKTFAINFLILYLLFSSFSIYQMLRAQQHINKDE